MNINNRGILKLFFGTSTIVILATSFNSEAAGPPVYNDAREANSKLEQ